MKASLLSLVDISKSFPGVQALDRVSMELQHGEVHCLVGQNGAGKSTLIKILAGVYRPETGQIYFEGQPIHLASPSSAINLGIGTIYQEFNLVPALSAAENMFLGNEPNGKFTWLMNRAAVYRAAKEIIARLAVDIDVKKPVEFMSVAEQQIVEIAKALAHESTVLVMDEPTAALTGQEVEKLFAVIRSLRERGTGIVYVSHRLDEITEIADRVTVLRDGRLVGSRLSSEIQPSEIVRMMIGQSIEKQYPYEEREAGDVVLEVNNYTREGHFHGVNLRLRRGEIVGLAGLAGAGQAELVRSIFGAETATQGKLFINGEPTAVRSPTAAIRNGIALVPEDRKTQGLVLIRSVRDNIVLASLRKLFKTFIVRGARMNEVGSQYMTRLNIAGGTLDREATYLSGGNQQKVVLAKWMLTGCDIVLFDEPTRGIDVGAKVQIYRLMNQLAGEGKAILMISSDFDEIVGICDRVLVMRNGGIVGEVHRNEGTEDRVMALAMGIDRS